LFRQFGNFYIFKALHSNLSTKNREANPGVLAWLAVCALRVTSVVLL